MPEEKLSKMSRIDLATRVRELEKRTDGWGNLLTGFGIENLDKRVSTTYYPGKAITKTELTDLYRGEGLAKRIIDVVVYDMVRAWFTIKNDQEDVIYKKLRSLKAKRYFKEALTWADVYGGSIILMGLDDGQELEMPLNENNLKEVAFLRVYDKEQVRIEDENLYKDPKENKYGQPELYTISPVQGGMEFKVHETRILRFDGAMVSDETLLENQGWGDSRYQAIYDRLKGLSSSYGNVELIIEEFIMGILKVENLQNLIQSGQENLVRQRLNLIDMAKHILNTILVDSSEEFTRLTGTITGLDSLVTKLELAMSGVTGIPSSLLFGDSPKGLNAAGQEEAQVHAYYDKISSRQEEKILTQAERLCYLIQKSKDGGTNGKMLEDWDIQFNPLYEPSQKEMIDAREKQSQIDERYYKMEALSADEIALARFGGITYSFETTLSDSHKEAMEERDIIAGEAIKEGNIISKARSVNDKPEDFIDEGQDR